jgi:hypothetical protein
MRLLTHQILAMTAAGLLAAACGGAGGAANVAPTAAPTVAPAAATAPTATPAPTMEAITVPPATASPTVPPTDGEGDEVIFGTLAVIQIVGDTDPDRVNGVQPIRNVKITFSETANDQRATGMSTWDPVSADIYTKTGPEWGPWRLENDNGAWEGPCSGAPWGDKELAWSCWLTGSGDYEGYTYYRVITKMHEQAVAQVVGVIYPGEPPK